MKIKKCIKIVLEEPLKILHTEKRHTILQEVKRSNYLFNDYLGRNVQTFEIEQIIVFHLRIGPVRMQVRVDPQSPLACRTGGVRSFHTKVSHRTRPLNRGAVFQQVWHDKDTPLSAGQRLSSVSYPSYEQKESIYMFWKKEVILTSNWHCITVPK